MVTLLEKLRYPFICSSMKGWMFRISSPRDIPSDNIVAEQLANHIWCPKTAWARVFEVSVFVTSACRVGFELRARV